MWQQRIKHSIDLLQRAEPMALRLNPKGYWLAFSGGKDSQTLYHVAKMAGVKFEAHYSLTTLDPPELVHFIRDNYPDVVIDHPKETFLQLVARKKQLPLRQARFCCAELKESKGKGFVTLIGIRRAESSRRAKRNEVETDNRKFSGSLDQFNRDKEVSDSCITGNVLIAPIIEWTDNDVWSFIRENSIDYCKLYNEGWHRLGCLFCPMSSAKIKKLELKCYPKYAEAVIRTIQRIMDRYGYMNNFPNVTAEQVFMAWISNESFGKFINSEKIQTKLDL